MAIKTGNLYARIEPQTKLSAESILESRGIPVSTAINMFYKQIILHNGLPFAAQLPTKNIPNLADMTESQFNAEMEKGFLSLQNSKGVSVDEAFASIKRIDK